MAVQTFSKMAVAYGNYVTPAAVANVVTGGITTLAGFPASNLEIEDPWVMMKTSTVSGTITIEHEFGSSVTPTVLGILNHNLGSAGYTSISAQRYNGSTFDTMATMLITSTGDSDVWIAWTAAASQTKWRINLGAAASNFYIGSIFYGVVHVVETNPLVMNQNRQIPVTVETASGGARYTSFGAAVRPAFCELTWSRTTITEVEFWRQVPNYKLMGILTPEHGDATTIILGQEVFWGYLASRALTPRGPGGQLTGAPARYDMTLTLEGAV